MIAPPKLLLLQLSKAIPFFGHAGELCQVEGVRLISLIYDSGMTQPNVISFGVFLETE